MLDITRRRLARCYSLADLRLAARRRLPGAVFDYLDGGAEDEVTLYRNSAGFAAYELLPRALVDVSRVDLQTTVLGQAVAWPVMLSPTGLSRLFHHEGEKAVVRAAARAGTIYTLSSVASYDIETIAAAADGPKWFQIYVWKDRAVVRDFIQRCRATGYQALCLTVDVPVLGQRERDLRNGMTMPPRLTLASIVDAALHPDWAWHYLTTPRPVLANVALLAGKGLDKLMTQAQHANSQLDPSVTWDDLAWMVQEWGGPFAIKGILSATDAKRAVAAGVQAIIVSNHGGRQLDHTPVPIDVLPEIVAAVGDRAEVILDGGVRRGSDVVKALALGARACMIGRGYLYGLGAGGEAGVNRALGLLRAEVQRTMQLLGCTAVGDLNSSWLRPTASRSRIDNADSCRHWEVL